MLFRLFTIFSFAFFLFIIANMSCHTATGQFFSDAANLFPFKDKGVHFVLMCGLSYLLNGSLLRKKISFFKNTILLGSLLLAVFMTLEESSQAFIPARNFEIMDLLCNYAGIYAGGLLMMMLPTAKRTDNDQYSTISIQAIFHRTR